MPATLAVGSALAVLAATAPPAASASDAPAASVPGALSLGLVARCVPTLPVFCANVHVACAGRTRRPTFSFDVRARDGVASLLPVRGGGGRTLQGPVRIDAANGSAIVALAPRPAYLRITPDGRFSLRQYPRGEALMAYGRCRVRD